MQTKPRKKRKRKQKKSYLIFIPTIPPRDTHPQPGAPLQLLHVTTRIHCATLPRRLSLMSLLASPTAFGAAAVRRRAAPLPLLPASGRAALHVALARRGGVSSRTQRRLEERGGKKRRGGVAAPEVDEEAAEAEAAEWEGEPLGFEVSTEPMPVLPDPETPDFWEGPQWEALGFFVQYMWAFGVVFGVSTPSTIHPLVLAC